MILDIHTHQLRRNAIVDLDPVDLLSPSPLYSLLSTSPLKKACRPLLRRGYLYSVGIHPWNWRRADSRALRLLRALAAEPQVIAIGECGLDAHHPQLPPSPPSILSTSPSKLSILESQTRLLDIHIALSEQLRKPLILHIVKAYQEIIALHNRWSPAQPWIIHGFRGKPQLARQLLDHGFHLSFGSRYNPASLAITPPSRLHRETDAPPTIYPLPPL